MMFQSYRFLLICQMFLLCKALNVTIVHTNDLHGRYVETDVHGFACTEELRNEKQCFGGVARLASAVKKIRNTEQNVILLDGGDRFSNTIWTEVYKGNATRRFVNELNYTALVLGNHEFDYGVQKLIQFLEGVRCPVVVSNLNTSQEPLWPKNSKLVKQTEIIAVGGTKIGIVGYVVTSTPRTTNAGDKIQFTPIKASLQDAVRQLESKGITKIIAVGHAGFDMDKKVAQKVKGIDIVIGGHTNTFLYTGDAPLNEKPEGLYPYIVHPDHNASLSVPVVQASKYSKYLGHLQVTFNKEGHVTSWGGNPILLDHKVIKDPATYDVVKKMKVLVDQKGEVIIGQSKVKLDASNNSCAVKPCVLGQVMAAAMLYHFKSRGAAVGFYSGNSIWKSLPSDSQGNVFYKDIFNSFPYWNTVDLVELSGADVVQSLEGSHSSFPQVQGIRVKYSAMKPTRLVETVEVHNSACGDSESCYQPINKTAVYKVAVNSYLATYANPVIVKKAISRLRGDSVYNVFVDYFKHNSPVTLTTEVNSATKLEQTCGLFSAITAWIVFIVF